MVQLIKLVRQQGGEVSVARNGHYRVVNPVNGQETQIAQTPKNARYYYNARTRLRRIGLLK